MERTWGSGNPSTFLDYTLWRLLSPVMLPGEKKIFTHRGPGTPCGEYLRRFWQPICFADELRDLPLRVRILGEDLVAAFRDFRGAVGLLELHCPHRGTSLEFGLISERGIRCCYHGWLFDVDGTILETQGRPASEHPEGPALPRRLPDPRVQWDRVCLYGTTGGAATIPRVR